MESATAFVTVFNMNDPQLFLAFVLLACGAIMFAVGSHIRSGMLMSSGLGLVMTTAFLLALNNLFSNRVWVRMSSAAGALLVVMAVVYLFLRLDGDDDSPE